MQRRHEALWDEKFRSVMIGRLTGTTRTFLHRHRRILGIMPAAAQVAAAQTTQAASLGDERRFRWAIAALVLATIAVRMPGIDRPLVGNFATKSAVYAMIARNWALDRAPIWRPTIDLTAGDERAWHLMEWPAAAFVAGQGWKLCGGSLDAWGRGVSIACSAGAVWLTMLLGRRLLGRTAAIAAGAVMAFSPVSIVYGQTFMLEASVAMFTLLTLYALEVGLDERRLGWIAVAAGAFSVLVVTKIYMLVLLLPLGLSLVRAKNRLAAAAIAIFVVALLPTAWWYAKVMQIPSTTGPAFEHHPLGRSTIHAFPHPLLFSASYYVRLATDFATHVLTPIGACVLLGGIAAFRRRGQLPLITLLAALGSLLIALPLKFFAANYYYVVLLPGVALATGAAWAEVQRHLSKPWMRAGIACVGLVAALRLAIGPAFATPPGDEAVEVAAAAARAAIPTGQPIATLHGSSVDLLYYCDRRGWALNAADPEFAAKVTEAAARGARYLIVADLAAARRRRETNAVLSDLPVVQAGSDWQLLSLESNSASTSDRAEVIREHSREVAVAKSKE